MYVYVDRYTIFNTQLGRIHVFRCISILEMYVYRLTHLPGYVRVYLKHGCLWHTYVNTHVGNHEVCCRYVCAFETQAIIFEEDVNPGTPACSSVVASVPNRYHRTPSDIPLAAIQIPPRLPLLLDGRRHVPR